MKNRNDVIVLFRDKYAHLKAVYPSVGPFDENRLYQNPDGGWQMNLENCAAITLRPNDDDPHETHGQICARWYEEGGAFNENGVSGKLGYPISDETSIEEKEIEYLSSWNSEYLDMMDRNGTLCQQDIDNYCHRIEIQQDDSDQLRSQGVEIPISKEGYAKYRIVRKWRLSKFQKGTISQRDIPSGNGHVHINYNEIDFEKQKPFSEIDKEKSKMVKSWLTKLSDFAAESWQDLRSRLPRQGKK